MVYLIDHPPRIRQFRSPRRQRPSGVVVVHTAESFPDETDPDTGAENVARFIARRTNYGSYHDLADSDSIIQLVRYSDEAFHDGTGSNPHSYGVSAATQAAKWNTLGNDWVDDCVRNMAKAAARYARWIKTHHGVTIPARLIRRAESERRKPGFISHAERDPDRRTDPGPTFPWGQFLSDYQAEMEDDMTPEQERLLEQTHHAVTHPVVATDPMLNLWPGFPPEGYNPRVYLRSNYSNTRILREQADKLDAKVDALLAAAGGLDTAAVLAHIDARHDAAATERAEILALVQAVGSGELQAADVVDEIARRLSAVD